jgi:hypothetical protein
MNKAQLAGTPIALPIILLLIGLLPVDGAADKSGDGNRPISGPLDGLVFVGELGPEGKPRDVSDTFVFDNGTFVSKECELRCKYPPRPYFVRVDGARTEFISETKCPYKDAWITWRGTVEGDTVRGKATWVVKRWYWTIEDTYEFEARLVTDSAVSANSD